MKEERQNCFQYFNKKQELPVTQQPTQSNSLKFFKTKTRINQEFFNIRIGLKILDYLTIQEDYIIYLVNLLASEAHFISAFIIDPNRLYFSMNITSRFRQNPDLSEIQLQSSVLMILKKAEQFFTQFERQYLSPESILGCNKSTEEILKKFQQQVIKKLIILQKQIICSH